jgi:hypothetical protein
MNLWLWVAGAFLLIAVTLFAASVAVALGSTPHGDVLTTPWAFGAYVVGLLAIPALLAAARGVPFPFTATPERASTPSLAPRPPRVSAEHRSEIHRTLLACAAAIENGQQIGWADDHASISRRVIEAHFSRLAGRLVEWEQTVGRDRLAGVALRDRFRRELDTLDLPSRYAIPAIVDGFSLWTAQRALSGELGTPVEVTGIWQVWGPVTHGPADGARLIGGRDLAISMEGISAEEYKEDAIALIEVVHKVFATAQAWPEAQEVANARAELDAFDRDAMTENIRELVARENIPTAAACPVCGAPSDDGDLQRDDLLGQAAQDLNSAAAFPRRPFRRPGKAWTAALAGLSVAVLIVVVSALDSGTQKRRVPEAPATGTLVTVPSAAGTGAPSKLSTSLAVEDRLHGHGFGTAIESDASDRLDFKLRIRNVSSTPTANLDLILLLCPVGVKCSDYKDASVVIAGFVEDGVLSYPALGPRVTIMPYSAFGNFSGDPVAEVFDNRGLPAGLLMSAASAKVKVPDGYTVAAALALGTLRPNQTKNVDATGTFAIPTSSELGGGSIIVFRPASGGTYAPGGVAAAGDRLRFSIMLNNSGFRARRVHLRVAIKPDHPASVVTLSAIVPEPGVPGGVLGTATVTSETGRPISLSVVPGTTDYYQGKTQCSKARLLVHLTNGIEHGGLVIGDVGGFVPFDSCHGSEFTRFVNFDVDVH